jgi:hypothetical protein
VFINPDPDAGPLEDYLEGIGEHFATAPTENRYTSAHVAKVLPANWKVSLEAFLESFHVVATHPQLLESNGDENAEYSVWPDKRHINRMIAPSGVASPHVGEVADQTVLDNYVLNRRYYGETARGRDLEANNDSSLTPGQTAREHIAGLLREQLRPLVGEERAEESTTSELLDGIQYFVFPNFVPWVATGTCLNYRFRPNGADPHSSIMEIYLLTPLAPGQEKPAPAPTLWLTEDQDWSDAPQLGRLGPVANQDSANIRQMQKGLRSMHRTPQLSFSRYQEVRIRHFHQTLDEYIAPE